MDPTTPTFQPGSPPPKPEPPAHSSVDAQRRTCRQCGESFKRGSQLMKHLRKTHWTDTTVTRTPEAVREQKPPAPSAQHTGQSQVHPFVLLSQRQQLLFVVHVVYMLCSIAVKLQEEEEKARELEREKHAQQSGRSWESPPPAERTLGPAMSTAQPAAHIYPRPPEQDSESEILDDDDEGGVPIYSPSSTWEPASSNERQSG
ncbi:hypothetical protein C8A03DRAFT_18679 [Achaetomium macrosporum]|uniref:C2H2-type domain-containing protein n=1 Tax=Achaetomium macrosporum TaxID=79813 RepID=A0AAN7H4F9_9PEZI|nr:hypothetical protein C8A03DRAFT_18679 [Achaetomium macrosporum]